MDQIVQNQLLNTFCLWGLDVIRFVQQIESPPLTIFAKIIAEFFYIPGYALLLAIIYWTIDSKQGFRLTAVILFSTSINTGIKSLLKVPRPFSVDSSVGLDFEESWSTPSGHSQASASFFPVLANSLKNGNRFIRLIIAIFIPIIVGLSRIYLGVHYPTDVFIGWIFGYIISLGVLLFWDYFAQKLISLKWSVKILLVAVVVLLLNVLNPDDTSMSGAFFGAYLGKILLDNKGDFDSSRGTLLQKLMRVVIGLASLGVVYIGLKFILPGEESSQYQLYRFLRYGILGFMISFGLPFLFIKSKLFGISK